MLACATPDTQHDVSRSFLFSHIEFFLLYFWNSKMFAAVMHNTQNGIWKIYHSKSHYFIFNWIFGFSFFLVDAKRELSVWLWLIFMCAVVNSHVTIHIAWLGLVLVNPSKAPCDTYPVIGGQAKRGATLMQYRCQLHESDRREFGECEKEIGCEGVKRRKQFACSAHRFGSTKSRCGHWLDIDFKVESAQSAHQQRKRK